MTETPLTWETKTVRIQSAPYPWDGTLNGYLELLDFIPRTHLRYGELETYPAKPTLQVYNDLEEQWLNVPKGHWLVKGLKGEFYPCESEAMEMKYKIVDPVLTIDKLRKGASGLPDGFDDPRIDNICHVLGKVLGLAQKNGAISLAQIEEIVANSTEFPDFWDDDRVW
jgi:hypothetical protein